MEAVRVILGSAFDSPTSELSVVDDGKIAQTYGFKHAGEDYFIQFNFPNMSQVLANELFFSERFRDCRVPVRRIVGHGSHDGLFYCISKKAEGEPFHLLDAEDQVRALRSVCDVMHRISRVSVDDTTGYGWLDGDCNGSFSSWAEHLLGIMNEDEDDFFGHWHELFRDSFLEKERFERYYAEMEGLIAFVPETRRLVHGGFGYGNVLVMDGAVTAVIDWQDARYGDPVFDLAAALFWRPKDLANRFLRGFREYAEASACPEDDLEQRIRCYEYYDGLDAMRFFAKQNDRDAYEKVVAVMETLVSCSP